MRTLPLLAAAALALTAGACAAPDRSPGRAASAEKVPADGAPTDAAGGSAKARAGQPWVYGDVRPGKGLLSDEEGGFTLYRQGEGPGSSDPSKPAKVRR